ncbi:unnamed protein product [Parascedosporium putredinis]|uniref:Uncharacterized protein n=1 Tax=Parascedosporium putredinis TaxID=1442378 RepID=A0A9P1H9E4_9PEZI|nr:unnamed protein product [Parascedosporium putredinis]CAI8001563.1 unnamed protein product [Parascedosporium putredinis]
MRVINTQTGRLETHIKHASIDRTSSSELTEAINSMYRWHREASVCYAYLTDVPTAAEAGSFTLKGSIRNRDEKWHWQPSDKFCKSRWFTCAWTLQPLIAPHAVEFYALDWTEIGTRASLTEVLCDITGIDQRVLSGAPVDM